MPHPLDEQYLQLNKKTRLHCVNGACGDGHRTVTYRCGCCGRKYQLTDFDSWNLETIAQKQERLRAETGAPMSTRQATVHDAAAYIIEQVGQLNIFRLHKLLYYCQAWSLVWDEDKLFDAKILAYPAGPFIPEIQIAHGRAGFESLYDINFWPRGNTNRLTVHEKATIKAVLHGYDKYTSTQLGDLAIQERPSREARKGLLPGERCENEIDTDVMQDYYGGLSSEPEPESESDPE